MLSMLSLLILLPSMISINCNTEKSDSHLLDIDTSEYSLCFHASQRYKYTRHCIQRGMWGRTAGTNLQTIKFRIIIHGC